MIHEHLNADGDVVGYTRILSPWDDQARAEAEALIEAEAMICPMCGNLREDCSDPERPWYPQRHICYASKVRDVADRKWTKKREGSEFHRGDERAFVKDYSAATPFHYRDGTRIYVAPVDVKPDDKFI